MNRAIMTCLATMFVASSLMAATIGVGGEGSFDYGHGTGGYAVFNADDTYAIKDILLQESKAFINNTGTEGYMVYHFQADEGFKISDFSMSPSFYLGNNLVTNIYYTTEYSADFASWTNLWNKPSADWPGNVDPGPLTAQPGSRDVFIAYQGTNNADAYWRWQLKSDTYSFTTVAVPEPATMCLVACGGLLALRRRKRK